MNPCPPELGIGSLSRFLSPSLSAPLYHLPHFLNFGHVTRPAYDTRWRLSPSSAALRALRRPEPLIRSHPGRPSVKGAERAGGGFLRGAVTWQDEQGVPAGARARAAFRIAGRAPRAALVSPPEVRALAVGRDGPETAAC